MRFHPLRAFSDGWKAGRQAVGCRMIGGADIPGWWLVGFDLAKESHRVGVGETGPGAFFSGKPKFSQETLDALAPMVIGEWVDNFGEPLDAPYEDARGRIRCLVRYETEVIRNIWTPIHGISWRIALAKGEA